MVRNGQPVHVTPIEFLRLLATLITKSRPGADAPPTTGKFNRPLERGHHLRIYMGHLRQKLKLIRRDPPPSYRNRRRLSVLPS